MTTPILGLTELQASQSQPEIIVNLDLRLLEAAIQLSVKSNVVTSPPGSPADGDRYIVAPDSTGVWTDKDGQVAVYVTTKWYFLVPKIGWLAHLETDNSYLKYTDVSPPEWTTVTIA